jgi:site-specific recombinase XerD
MTAARAHPLSRYRLVAEMLARTGLRASELCELAADAVTQIGDAHWRSASCESPAQGP